MNGGKETVEIEIKEVSPSELRNSGKVEDEWKDFGPVVCLKCGSRKGFILRAFIIARCPESRQEEEWLDKTMKERHGVENYGISAGVLGDEQAILDVAICKRCGSQDIFFDV